MLFEVFKEGLYESIYKGIQDGFQDGILDGILGDILDGILVQLYSITINLIGVPRSITLRVSGVTECSYIHWKVLSILFPNLLSFEVVDALVLE